MYSIVIVWHCIHSTWIYNFIGNEDEMLKLVQYLVCQLNINKGCTDDNDTKDTDDNTMKNIRDDLHKLVTMIGSSKDMSLYPPSRGGKTKSYSLYAQHTHQL